MRAAALIGLGLLAPFATASALDVSVDAFYTADASVRIEDRDSGNKAKLNDGDGEGVRVVLWPVDSMLFFSAELANVRDAEGPAGTTALSENARYQQIRVGIGAINRSAFYTRFEVVRSDLRSEQRNAANLLVTDTKRNATGLTALVGIAGAMHSRLLGSIEVGYQDLDLLEDTDDGEAEFGRGFIGTARIDIPVHSRVQIFGEYRYQQGRSDNTGIDIQTDLSEARIGLRFNVL